MKLRARFRLTKYLVKQSVWMVARIFGYWHKNKQLPYPMVIGCNEREDVEWWRKEIIKLNKKSQKRFKKAKKE